MTSTRQKAETWAGLVGFPHQHPGAGATTTTTTTTTKTNTIIIGGDLPATIILYPHSLCYFTATLPLPALKNSSPSGRLACGKITAPPYPRKQQRRKEQCLAMAVSILSRDACRSTLATRYVRLPCCHAVSGGGRTDQMLRRLSQQRFGDVLGSPKRWLTRRMGEQLAPDDAYLSCECFPLPPRRRVEW